MINERQFLQILNDVSSHYGSPAKLWGDGRVTREQKVRALRQWEQDLRLIERASEESMGGPGSSSYGTTAETLREVHNLLAQAGALE